MNAHMFAIGIIFNLTSLQCHKTYNPSILCLCEGLLASNCSALHCLASDPLQIQRVAPPLPSMKPNGAGHDVRSALCSIAHHLVYMEVKLEDVEGKRHCRMRPQHAVHLIPVVLILCALILWLSACNRSSYSLLEGNGVSGEFVRVIRVENSMNLGANGMVEETSNGGSRSNGSHGGGLRSGEVMRLGNHWKRGSSSNVSNLNHAIRKMKSFG